VINLVEQDPRISIGLAYFQAFLPKKDISKNRLAVIRRDGIDIDSIDENVYVTRNNNEYPRAPENSWPAKRTIAIFGEQFSSGYVIEEADGFLTPYGVFYAEFS